MMGLECILKSGKKLGSGEVIIYEKGFYSGRSRSREVDWEKDDREEMPCTWTRVLWYGIEVFVVICGILWLVCGSRGGSLWV